MQSDLKRVLDQIHADEPLKAATRRFVRETVYEKSTRRTRAKRTVGYALSAALLLCVILGGYHLYFTPTSVISFDSNPSIELDVNRFDKIIDVRSYHADGAQLASSLSVKNKTYQDAIHTVLDDEALSDRLAAGGLLSITVVQTDQQQGEEIFGFLSECTANQGNVACCRVNAEEVAEAHSVGLSYGKYRYYLQIAAYDPQITPEQVSGMSMREIRDLLYALEGTEQRPAYGNGAQQGSGNRHQYGKMRDTALFPGCVSLIISPQ